MGFKDNKHQCSEVHTTVRDSFHCLVSICFQNYKDCILLLITECSVDEEGVGWVLKTTSVGYQCSEVHTAHNADEERGWMGFKALSVQ